MVNQIWLYNEHMNGIKKSVITAQVVSERTDRQDETTVSDLLDSVVITKVSSSENANRYGQLAGLTGHRMNSFKFFILGIPIGRALAILAVLK